MNSADILIVDSFHPLLLEILDKAGITYHYLPEIPASEIGTALATGYKGLVIRSKARVDESLLRMSPQLKLIARGGAGMDNIDTDLTSKLGIITLNAGEANSTAVSEHTLGILLSLLHKISSSDAQIRNRQWLREANRGIELAGKTVGIIGFGNTGSAVAKRLSGFDLRVLAYDKYKKGFGNSLVEEVSMDKIFTSADIVTLHIPLDGHTRFMVNSDYLQSFVRNIFLLNLSRGEIVNTLDVLNGIRNGKILGFGADVLEHEDPLQMGDTEKKWFEELIQLDQVVLTPHVAGWTQESLLGIARVLGEKIVLNTALVKG